MKFRILRRDTMFVPQVAKEVWNGVTWEDKWADIGIKGGYEHKDSAKLQCIAYKADVQPEVVEEFTL